MEFFKPGIFFDVMQYRRFFVVASTLINILTFIGLYKPGPKLGIDFAGGTEVQLRFKQNIDAGEVRKTLESLGYEGPDVVSVQGSRTEYIIRVNRVSSISEAQKKNLHDQLQGKLGDNGIHEWKISPGGDKLSFRLSEDVDAATLQQHVIDSGGKALDAHAFGRAGDHRYEVRLAGVAEEMVHGLDTKLGTRGPEAPRRVEWVGPKAGAQLRDAAIKAILYAIVFIMIYVALRFDLRFAPGAAISLVHDAIVALGFIILIRQEVNLTTVAALLTIVGYSISDTIVIYDRIRENMARMRDKSLYDIINISTSQTISRTVITAGTVLMSLSCFFIWGTPILKDFALALIVGIGSGVYSSIYIAAPVTEWMDRHVFATK